MQYSLKLHLDASTAQRGDLSYSTIDKNNFVGRGQPPTPWSPPDALSLCKPRVVTGSGASCPHRQKRERFAPAAWCCGCRFVLSHQVTRTLIGRDTSVFRFKSTVFLAPTPIVVFLSPTPILTYIYLRRAGRLLRIYLWVLCMREELCPPITNQCCHDTVVRFRFFSRSI